MEQVYAGKQNESIQAIYRLGNQMVNWYLISDRTGVTLIDAGFPGHWRQLEQAMAQLGRRMTDIKAIVVTHVHTDHIGFAERARRELGTQIWVHTADAEHSSLDMPIPTRKGLLWKAMRRPQALIGVAKAMLLDGVMNKQPITQVRAFADGDILPVPGRPQAIHVPGHTLGSTAFYLPTSGVLFSGDEVVTARPVVGEAMPPGVIPDPVNADEELSRESLGRLASLGEVLLLPGHGAPWYGDLAKAIARSLQVVPMSLA